MAERRRIANFEIHTPGSPFRSHEERHSQRCKHQSGHDNRWQKSQRCHYSKGNPKHNELNCQKTFYETRFDSFLQEIDVV